MSQRSIVVGTAGHIDHGKTTLIGALTGVNTDRLEAEQERGITIELGFAPLDIDDLHIGFVDVPGHEKFVKNMLAGAGGIDAMLLVVAADESIMPQTREHVEICRLLGLRHAVAAVTKSDIADSDSVELVTLETQELLEENGFEDVNIVPVSGATGDGLEELKGALRTMAAGVKSRNLDSVPRVPIDRVFTIKGHGTVVTGTLISGELSVGDKLMVYPAGTPTTVKSLQVHSQSVDTVIAGHRVAINLANIGTEEIERGSTLAPADSMLVSANWDIDCTALATSPCDIEQNMRVRVHAGTAEVLARVSLPGGEPLQAGSRGILRLRFEEPVAGYIGDRLVLRRYSPMITVAGGIVLDNAPPIFAHGMRENIAALQQVTAEQESDRLQSVIAHLPGVMTARDMIVRFGMTASAVGLAIDQALKQDNAVRVADSPAAVVSAARFSQVCQQCREQLESLHQQHPLKPGFHISAIKQGLTPEPEDVLLRAALQRLEDQGDVNVSEGKLNLADFQIELDDEQHQAVDSMVDAFRKGAFGPPQPEDAMAATGHPDAEALFELLLHRGEIRLIAEDYFLHAEMLSRLREILAERAGDTPFSVPEFKEWLGISRKYAIPLLEYLDRQSITHRKGDERYLNK